MNEAENRTELWAVNAGREAVEATLEIKSWSLQGELLGEERRSVNLKANEVSELGYKTLTAEKARMVSARLLVDGQVVARATGWPQPFKYYQLFDPELELRWVNPTTLCVSVIRPAKGVWLTTPGKDGVSWSDNMLDLVPGDPQFITVNGLSETDSIETNWLGKASQLSFKPEMASVALLSNQEISN